MTSRQVGENISELSMPVSGNIMELSTAKSVKADRGVKDEGVTTIALMTVLFIDTDAE